MEYVNRKTGTRIKLDRLNAEEKKFYQLALRRFRENVRWVDFDDFTLGLKSPIYRKRESHLDILKDPLYLALQDMSLQLGVQQGMISRKKIKEKNSVA
jgi:hypothetical protein